MKNQKIVKTIGETLYLKRRGIPLGCQHCLNGAKTVLFLNGICQNPNHCWWYCPISKERKGKSNTFANEIQIKSIEGLLEEIKKTNSKGISITGGDPLYPDSLEKALDYIKYIKNNMGNEFHIHLYTNGLNFNEDIANKLSRAGLDEIRFNPPLITSEWNMIKFALNKGMSVGAEVPVIPDNIYVERLKEFILYLDDIGAEFINLNEFEYCFPNSEKLKEKGFKLKNGTIASVEGSRKYAESLINEISSKVLLKIHYCPIIAKDYYQLRARYLRRAKNIKLPYENINDDGLLMFGQIEGDHFILSQVFSILQEISSEMIVIDEVIKLSVNLIINEKVGELIKSNKLKGFIVEITPFREDQHRQITEKTPLDVYRMERGYYEN
jgi:pyruvate formate-lyase activating enzyme-like uncharacterized protein